MPSATFALAFDANVTAFALAFAIDSTLHHLILRITFPINVDLFQMGSFTPPPQHR